MAGKFQAPRGTTDLLPEASAAQRTVVSAFERVLASAGFGMIETPIFEETDLFERGVGASTDIVRKEMFTFEDKGGRSLTLRPEGTAPVCRAYVEHGMSKLPQPVRLGYSGPFFRHERPQAGRFREFHQIGVEVIGSASPIADAEAIGLLARVLSDLSVPGIELRLGSLGSLEARQGYLGDLRSYLESRSNELSDDVRDRIETNPLRAFDADDEGTARVMEEAPRLLDRLEGEDREHFDEVISLLESVGIPFEVDPGLVRGLDYYTRTIFSFVCDRLGAQSEIGGGGRYDGLVADLGGPDSPAIGWAAGVERILLALDHESSVDGMDLFVAWEQEDQIAEALRLVGEARARDLVAGLDLGARNLKGQLKQADRAGAKRTLILKPDGAGELKEMDSGEQVTVDPAEAIRSLPS